MWGNTTGNIGGIQVYMHAHGFIETSHHIRYSYSK
jgi:hypothetical protein